MPESIDNFTDSFADEVFSEYERPVCMIVSKDIMGKIETIATIEGTPEAGEVNAFMGIKVHEDPELPADTIETYYDIKEANKRLEEIE